MVHTANFVSQKSLSLGTGVFVLQNLVGYRSFILAFPASSVSALFYYFIRHRNAAEWEVGEGYLNTDGNLVRNNVIRSSNSDTFVDFSQGVKDVRNDVPASFQEQLVTLQADLAAKPTISTPNTWTKQQNIAASDLTDALIVTWDMDAQANPFLLATAAIGNTRALANPTNAKPLAEGSFVFKQDSVGNRTMTFGTMFVPLGGPFVFSTAANAEDIISWKVNRDATKINMVITKGF